MRARAKISARAHPRLRSTQTSQYLFGTPSAAHITITHRHFHAYSFHTSNVTVAFAGARSPRCCAAHLLPSSLHVVLLVSRAQDECTLSRVCPRWPSRQVTLRCCRGGAPSTSLGGRYPLRTCQTPIGSRSCFQVAVIPVLRQGEPRKRCSSRCPTMRA